MTARDGRHARWDDHREQRRRHIIDAAVEVVEAAPPGAELTLQDVADRAGLVRTVVQRHFGGRVPLVRAVQADVLAQAFGLISAPIEFSASLNDIVTEAVAVTVAWVDTHPGLHALVERELGDGQPSELSRAIERYADLLAAFQRDISAALGVELTPEQVEESRLLLAGLIGQVRASVGYWAVKRPRVLSADQVRDLLVPTIALQVSRLAAAYGVALPPDRPLIELSPQA